jgi:purine-cytosine permease-like protein
MSDRVEKRTDPTVEDALRIEIHGFDYIPETERYLRPKQLFSFWVGANAYLYYVFIGGLLVFFRRQPDGRWLAVHEHLSPAP